MQGQPSARRFPMLLLTNIKSYNTHLIDLARETSARSFDVLRPMFVAITLSSARRIYLRSDGDRPSFALEPMVYDTVINVNRTGHWSCHERSSEKRVMLKAAHTNHCELP